MKTLVVEDDFTSRILLNEILQQYGPVHVAVNGKEAVAAVQIALKAKERYDLICLDIMMPEMDGQTALSAIRAAEEAVGLTSTYGSKIVMTTALGDVGNVSKSFYRLCDAYLVKPIDRAMFQAELRKLGLIS
jgi:two-component system chemotaxis response regulator CheY